MKQSKQGVSSVLIVVGVIAAIIIVLALLLIGSYNTLVSKDTSADKAWGNVQAAYQRRADLIPNLVDTVKGAANFEQDTLTQITALRGEAVSASQKTQAATSPAQLQESGGEINSVLSRLLVIVENYPQLTATKNFQDLQSQLEGTENRINFERNNYNEAVRDYLTSVRSFPTVLFAGMFGFSQSKHTTFAADQGAQQAPRVNFP